MSWALIGRAQRFGRHWQHRAIGGIGRAVWLESMDARKLCKSSLALIVVLTLAACGRSLQQKEASYLKRGQDLMARKDYPRAFLEFKNAAAAQPQDAEPYYQMGLTALAAGNSNDAARALKRATELNPRHAGAQLKVAELMTATRDPKLAEEAESRLKQVLLASPDNPETIDALAFAEYQLGKAEDASTHLQEALKKFPAHLASAVALAKLKLVIGDVDGAEDVLKSAVASAPDSANAAAALAQFYLTRQKFDLAEAEVLGALKLDARNSSALLTLAAIQMHSHLAAEAEQTYKILSALPDQRYRPLHAMFLFRQNQREAALTELKKLAGKYPEDRATRSRLVALYGLMNRIPEAEQELDAALKRNPNDQDALWQRGQLYLETGKISQAENDLQRVLRFRPDWAEAHFALARARGLKGEARSERQELAEAIRLNRNLLEARLVLARSFIAIGDTKSALQVLDEAPAPQKKTLDFLIERNWEMLRTGNSREPRYYIDAILKIERVPEAILQDGVVKLGDKDYAGARGDAEEVLRKDPENVKAAHLLVDSYLAQKQLSPAVDRVRQLVSQRPSSAALRFLLAQLLVSSNDLVQARVAFAAAKKAAPQSFEVDLAMAGLDVAENRIFDARQKLSAIVARDGTNVRALLLLADLTAPIDETAAIALYRSAMAVDATNVIALNNLAYLLAKDKPDEAVKLAQQAVELAPESVDVQDTLGWVYYRKGLYSAALSHLQLALQNAPTPVRKFHLGMTYLKTGEDRLGKEMVRAALLQDPNLVKTERGW